MPFINLDPRSGGNTNQNASNTQPAVVTQDSNSSTQSAQDELSKTNAGLYSPAEKVREFSGPKFDDDQPNAAPAQSLDLDQKVAAFNSQSVAQVAEPVPTPVSAPAGTLVLQGQLPQTQMSTSEAEMEPVNLDSLAPLPDLKPDQSLTAETELNKTKSDAPINVAQPGLGEIVLGTEPGQNPAVVPNVAEASISQAQSVNEPAVVGEIGESLPSLSHPDSSEQTPDLRTPVVADEPVVAVVAGTVPAVAAVMGEVANSTEAEAKIPPDAAKLQAVETAVPSGGKLNINSILADALKRGASDVHLNVGYRVIARIDGDLAPLPSPALNNEMVKQMLADVLHNRPDQKLDEIRDLDLAYSLPDGSARFRVNIFREKENFAGVFRLIPEKIRTVEELFLPNVLREFTKLEQGLVLVTGATGSGKSTTIAALINEINLTQPKHIVTIEDPIEYIYPRGQAVISQRNVNDDTKSWEVALRSILRQDPDIVLVGEMRDLETIAAAMTVAETGHLVFATLHTNSAAQSVDRIIDVFPEYQQNQIRTQLATVLTAVVSQKLVPATGGGRRVATELMIVNSAVRALIRDNKVYQIDNMIQTSADQGMVSMERSLANLVREGLVSPEMAQQYANKPADLLTLLR